MKNKGQLGEFHWSGFAIAFVLCLAFALTAYTRFKFSQEAPNQDLKTRIELLEEEVRDLQRQSKELKVCPVVQSLPVAQSIKSTAEHKKIPAVGVVPAGESLGMKTYKWAKEYATNGSVESTEVCK